MANSHSCAPLASLSFPRARCEEVAQVIEKGLNDRTQRSIFQRQNDHRPRPDWQSDGERLQCKTFGVEAENGVRERRDELSGADQICAQVRGERFQAYSRSGQTL